MEGLGVLINALGGNEDSVKVFKEALGKKIEKLCLKDNKLQFGMEGGQELDLVDDGQSCCEQRYFTTDDDLDYFVGATLMGGEVRDAPSIDDEYGEHNVNFLVITTSKGCFTIEAHNEHNGYYGGFWIIAKKGGEIEDEE